MLGSVSGFTKHFGARRLFERIRLDLIMLQHVHLQRMFTTEALVANLTIRILLPTLSPKDLLFYLLRFFVCDSSLDPYFWVHG